MPKREWTPEQRQAQRERMAKLHSVRQMAKAAKKAAREGEASVTEPMEAGPSAGPLTDAEIATVRRRALEQIEKELTEKRDAERAAVIDQELAAELYRQRVAAGLIEASCGNDQVTFVVDLAPYAQDLKIDGVRYVHGFQYTVPRHKYNDIRWIMAKSWDHEESCGYPNKKLFRPISPGLTTNQQAHHAYMRPHLTTISETTGGVANVPIITRL